MPQKYIKIALLDDDLINTEDRKNNDQQKIGIINRLRSLFKKDSNNKKKTPLPVTDSLNTNIRKLCVYNRTEHKRMQYDIVSSTSQISSKYTDR